METEIQQPDQGVTFDLPADPAAPAPRNYTQDANLVDQLSPEEQAKIAKDIAANYDRDWESGKKFRQRRIRQVELFAGIMPEKQPGQERIAQIHLSIIAQSVLILHATIHGQLFPPTNHIYGARAVTPAATERVERLGRHMNWQVTTKIPEYLPAVDRGMMQWLIYGTMFDCWYFDPVENRPCYEVIHTDDLVMPYTSKSVRYDLADVPRKTKKVRKYEHEVEQLRDVGYWSNTDQLFELDPDAQAAAEVDALTPGSPSLRMARPERESDDKRPMQKAEDRIQGQSEPADDPSAPRLFLEQHYWLKLPGEKSHRPVIGTIDNEKKILVRLVLREDEDPRDRSRYDRDMAAREAHIAAMQAQHEQAMSEWSASVQHATQPQPVTDETGNPVPHPETGEPMMQPPVGADQLPEPPQPPAEPEMPKPIRMVPVEWFTKFGCIPNPEGIYDFGVGYLLEGDNIAADTLMSQYVSAMTLACLPTFFYSKQAKMQRGDLKVRLGEGIEVPLPPDSLQKAFFQFQFPTPPNAVQKLIEQREQSAQQLVGASNILTGEPGEANETATSVQIRTNSARMNLAEMGNRFNSARQNSMKNLARLNAKTMDPVEYFSVVLPGTNAPAQAETIARDDYLEDFQVTFHCDPRLASQPQRVQDALALLTQLLQIPPGAINPQAQQMAITMALVGYLRALDRDDMANIIEQAPPPPQPGMPPGAPPGGPPQPGGPSGKPGEPGPGAKGPAGVRGPHPGAPANVGANAGNPAVPRPTPAGPGAPGGGS